MARNSNGLFFRTGRLYFLLITHHMINIHLTSITPNNRAVCGGWTGGAGG
jgi:hypothetical protein